MLQPAEPELAARARRHPDRTALIARGGTFSYGALLAASARVARGLLQGRRDLEEARVAFLAPPGFPWVALQWGIWRAGGIAVPLAPSHPAPELARVLDDADVECAVAAEELAAGLAPVCRDEGKRLLAAGALLAHPGVTPGELPEVDPGRRALIVYTSGSTGRPKGAVWSHANLAFQARTLAQAWGFTPGDRVLHVLPLHHVHGMVNALAVPLWAGASCEMLSGFDATRVWETFARGGVSVFMGVPTLYRRLVAAWEGLDPERRGALARAAAGLRLAISGSATLPVDLLERWREIAGGTLLERYGMTELGMVLSNPLEGPRVPGAVGRPLPGVEVRLVDEAGRPSGTGEAGEIEVRGSGVFREYWRRPSATAAAFRDRWFRTGDLAVAEGGVYRILGRLSTDIIKSGGYKLSALEIEAVLARHPAVAECAVVAVPDAEWGETAGAVVVVREGASLDLPGLRQWARRRLAPYKLPGRLALVDALPRNALGKVVKPRLRGVFGGEA